MTLSQHTKLMNYVIGMCTKTANWPCVFFQHGYKVQLIEKSIRTTAGHTVVPDIIAASGKTLHALIFDCKGGITVEQDQVQRYGTLEHYNFSNYLDIHDREHMTFDVCYADIYQNHSAIREHIGNFPVITFGDSITKENDFKLPMLNKSLRNPISLEGSRPPLSYYPFSERDDRCEIIPHLLRALISIAIEKNKGQMDVVSNKILENEEVLQRVHKMWNALSKQHREILERKMKEIFEILKNQYKDTFALQLQEIQEKEGYHINTTLSSFSKSCEKIMMDCDKMKAESQTLLTDHKEG